MKKLLLAISTLFIIWCVLSTAEVVAKNTKPNPQYSPLNIWTMFLVQDEPATTKLVSISNVEAQTYTAYGRYYTDGTVIVDYGDGALSKWEYSTDTISDKTPYDAMPVWVGFSDNGTPDEVTDDIILGLVYDRNTAIYDQLEESLSEEFEIKRDGNNIRIGGIK